MEHWVRSYLQSTDSDYDLHSYTFTQKFVGGYAEVYVYLNARSTGESRLANIFRVNADGYLEISKADEPDNWQVVSQQYN